MTKEQANRLIIGQQVWFCVFAVNDDVSGLLFGTGAYRGRIDEERLAIQTGKGTPAAFEYQTFFTSEELTAYLMRYFAIDNERVKYT